MSKRKKIIYWVFTLWMSLGMVSTGIVQVSGAAAEVDRVQHLGYPVYLLHLLGACKLLGVVAVLLPKLPVWKEWAYAGFFFTLAGALFSHLVMGDPFKDTFPSVLLLILTAISWLFRPADRKMAR